ncbi:MAG: tryptophan synthase subunit alpha [Myxococcales bacterium]|nr:tryptophan synthase subunit alpha [Myxococcales bacterium]USN51697.1 MAG: tryptophan synthase subunit alpha [Myxococcales bacterium]
MSRYEKMFFELAQKNQGAFIPFVMLYDPDRAQCKKIIKTLIESGADALELGIAFSDPLADGPTIQKAGLRALHSRATVHESLDLVQEIRQEYPSVPIGILTYANLIFKNSLDWFYAHARDCGVDSVLVADVPILEIKPFYEAAIKHGVDPVLVAPINMPHERLKDVEHYGRGYTYVVTREGVTGADEKINFHHKDFLRALKNAGAPPAIFGFGISSPEHVSQALKQGAQGVISGSKIVSLIEGNLNSPEHMLDELALFVKAMKAATKLA